MAVEDVYVRTPDAELPGLLTVPDGAGALVIFAHGSGSSRLSPRNAVVAGTLSDAGLATLLFDLLTPAEAEHRRLVFDVGMLALRLRGAIDWARWLRLTATLPVGLFGASTGAAAALIAAAEERRVGAVVSRGGRPDLAGHALARVRAPTLLIVGSLDDACIPLNEIAYASLHCEKRLEIVPRATHLFDEPGTIETVASLACDWFTSHLVRAGEAG
ncbi:MAG: hypothetical protein KIS87_00070 [Phycisphaeraceae bacterium]|nr:hypothetical protein [Phycisphaeraceae bacterium]